MEPESAVAALVHMAHRNELDKSAYRTIELIHLKDFKHRDRDAARGSSRRRKFFGHNRSRNSSFRFNDKSKRSRARG